MAAMIFGNWRPSGHSAPPSSSDSQPLRHPHADLLRHAPRNRRPDPNAPLRPRPDRLRRGDRPVENARRRWPALREAAALAADPLRGANGCDRYRRFATTGTRSRLVGPHAREQVAGHGATDLVGVAEVFSDNLTAVADQDGCPDIEVFAQGVRSASTNSYVGRLRRSVSMPSEAWQEWQGSAFARVRSRSLARTKTLQTRWIERTGVG
jgi:hypothetical protein